MDNTHATFLRPSSVAKMCRVSRATVHGWIASGRLRASNVGKSRPRWIISAAELTRFLDSLTSSAAKV